MEDDEKVWCIVYRTSKWIADGSSDREEGPFLRSDAETRAKKIKDVLKKSGQNCLVKILRVRA